MHYWGMFSDLNYFKPVNFCPFNTMTIDAQIFLILLFLLQFLSTRCRQELDNEAEFKH